MFNRLLFTMLLLASHEPAIDSEGNFEAPATRAAPSTSAPSSFIAIRAIDPTLSEVEFEKRIEEVISDRTRFIGRLIDQLRTKTNTEKKAAICFALGRFRAEQAIDALAENLLFTPRRYWTGISYGERPLWSAAPAGQALVAIGHASIPRMIEVIKRSPDKEERSAAAGVIAMIYAFEDEESGIIEARIRTAEVLHRCARSEKERLHAQRLRVAAVQLLELNVVPAGKE